MKSAREFAEWLRDCFGKESGGVYLTREDITSLSGRQHFNQQFVSDIHHELTQLGMGFVTDMHRERFYLFHLPKVHWKELGDGFDETNIHRMAAKQAPQKE
ncbi:hypothetical protein MBH78_07050 [Oceanimonas sp. NS1]|uniref:Uncharacterized protein n=1 Tax=Oceanimonas doudoroffii TaxID=84158 RepID=A0A233RE79_9GAMM|nr:MULTISPECIES: hypothetical protein [Oceanimonas]MCT7654608.1 hypothetical protein [Oceanimonas sp. NS1]NHH99237.1 hypothetical protein [Oceanimonas sp. MB9]OXY81698.1 hypothetical protein B6S08_12105 [Oceanimonas doudoroffii]